jgi:hypothetical protein
MTARNTKAKRVAIYSRYSSDLQNDRSIEDQIVVCEKFAAKNGWVVKGNFYDRAASGASLFGRPGVVKRIYEEYVAGASPRSIAAGLNTDNIPAPRGGKWNASTINGNTARGQGLLLNERFVGRVVWNKRRSVKDPKTGRRVTRTNPESEWVVQQVPALRILDDKLTALSYATPSGI